MSDQEKHSSHHTSIPTADSVSTDAWDWVLTVIYGVVFFLILLVFDLLQRIAILFGRRAHELAVLGLNKSLAASLRLLGVRITIDGINNLDAGRAYIVVSNHQALFYIPILHSLFGSHQLRCIAKQ